MSAYMLFKLYLVLLRFFYNSRWKQSKLSLILCIWKGLESPLMHISEELSLRWSYSVTIDKY